MPSKERMKKQIQCLVGRSMLRYAYQNGLIADRRNGKRHIVTRHISNDDLLKTIGQMIGDTLDAK
jgi:hypothetical protein